MKFEDLIIEEYDEDGVMHRGSCDTLTHYVSNLHGRYQDIEVLVVKDRFNQWWITPSNAGQEDEMDDVGPYEDLMDIVLTFKLTVDPVE
jgi:hypothetical protein